MRLSDLSLPKTFRTAEEVRDGLLAVCREHADLARAEVLGESEGGRPLLGITLGRGDTCVSLIAGNHSDEPVGPETLRTLVMEGLAHRDELEELFETYRFVIVPHTNPDGEAKNQPWIRCWPSLPAYLTHAFREPPGRDMEFGFPDLRAENRLVSGFLGRHGPYALHMSLHGMGFSDGAQLLIERHWGYRTDTLQEQFASAAAEAQLRLHDRNRRGEKGFFYLGPGFNTTPEGEAMRTFFHARDDSETAGRFLDSSMEFVRSLGGDPLCLVTELPLFVLTSANTEGYLRFRSSLPALRDTLARGESIDEDVAAYAPQPLPLTTAASLQLKVLEAALQTVSRAPNA